MSYREPLAEPVELICSRCAANLGTTDNAAFIAVAKEKRMWCSEYCLAASVQFSAERMPTTYYAPADDGSVNVRMELTI